MKTVSQNIDALEKAIVELKAHPMCLKFVDDGASFTVVYPDGDFAVDGLRADYRDGKLKAIERLLPVMERHWMESYP